MHKLYKVTNREIRSKAKTVIAALSQLKFEDIVKAKLENKMDLELGLNLVLREIRKLKH